ncbi:DUF6384 family protein [Tautonia rosea]|uniref:DUF6384 family protein n=1 Tax=Tautonia rosea TaxID=2728037 RepID=UPI0014737854|nr:DUF6384 family protein [Tautonia rosea]
MPPPQSTTLLPTEPAPSGSPGDPSLGEMLQILEASARMRKDRDLVAEQLNLNEVKARLRDRILAAARASGDPVRPEEVDVAIDHYYDSLYDFREPPLSPEVALAHLYVRRWSLSAVLVTFGIGLALLWLLLLRPMAPLSPSARTERAVASLNQRIEQQASQLTALAEGPEAANRIEQLRNEALALVEIQDTAGLERVQARLDLLGEALQAEYDVEIVREPGRMSGIDTYYNDDQGRRLAGYYLIVEARGPDGRPLPRPIRNEETGQTTTVTTWAERVPEAVYQRLLNDKQADGRVDDFLFAVKRRGQPDEQVRMLGEDGRPLSRLGQITEW